MKLKLSPNLIRFFCIFSLVFMAACGDDNDSTNVVLDPPQQEQDTTGNNGNGNSPNGTSTTVIVNNKIDNDVKLINKSKVENNAFVFNWTVQNADPVTHQQFIHRGNVCPTLEANDLNRDGLLDEAEVQQAVGPRVYGLQSETTFPDGSTYNFTRSVSLTELWGFVPPGEQFVVVIYGARTDYVLPPTFQTVTTDPTHATVPIACRSFTCPTVERAEPTNNPTPDDNGGDRPQGTTDDTTPDDNGGTTPQGPTDDTTPDDNGGDTPQGPTDDTTPDDNGGDTPQGPTDDTNPDDEVIVEDTDDIILD